MCSRLAFVLITLVTTFICSSRAAEWSKLKKCSDLGFGRRQRLFSPSSDVIYKLAKETISVSEWRGQSAVKATLNAKDRPSFLLIIIALANGVYRIVIDDAAPPKYERHIVKDVIMPYVDAVPLKDQYVFVRDDRADIVIDELPSKMVLHYEPFRVDFVRKEDDLVLASFNSESMLLVDTFLEKPIPSEDQTHSEMNSQSPDLDESKDDDKKPDGEDEVSDYGGVNEDDLDEDVPHEDSNQGDVTKSTTCDGCWEETFQSHTDSKPRGPEAIGVDVSFPFANHLYGIPERTVRFSLEDTIGENGSILSEPYRLYNLDIFEFELVKPLGLYGSIPFLFARNGKDNAGFLWLNTAETYVDIKTSAKGRHSHWFSETGLIDTFFLPGPTVSDVFQQYLWLTGVPAMPQRFSLGYHQCRWNYRDEEDSKTVDAKFDELNLPYDVLWLDIEHTNGKRYFTWDYERFPDPSGLMNHIAARGRKMVTIIDPHIKRDNKFPIHRMAQEQKLYVMKPDGKPFDGWCWPGSSSYFDFSSSRVREVWASLFSPTHYPHYCNHLYTWNDMNEPSVFNGPEGTMQKDLVHEGNVEHRHLHNIFGHYFFQATYEGILKGHGGNDRPFVLSRSFFAGSQKFGAIWTGDNSAVWNHLESSVRMLLSLQVSGMTFSGADVGGFFGNPSAELTTRWYQAAAFQPFFRGHSHLDTNRREPWVFGDPYTSHISEAVKARYSYIPFWYTLFAGHALGTGSGFEESARGPPMRPLWWHFPNDPEAESNEKQWLVGNALLVAPVLEEGVSTHKIYIPPGESWYDLYNPHAGGKKIDESAWAQMDVTLDRMIVFQRGGTIVPKQERCRRSTAAMAHDPFTLVVALNNKKEARGELYMDDGKSFDYKSGAYAVRQFIFEGGELRAEIVSEGTAAFEGDDAEIERVMILGYGEAPVAVSSGANPINFVYSKNSGALTLQNVRLKAAKGNWKITIR
ncbi:Neutral alpha-glucosidase AB [Gracilaria domingensis]|nr:Neutral alpha-glucosidase AB [Gracilaria domingensis]